MPTVDTTIIEPIEHTYNCPLAIWCTGLLDNTVSIATMSKYLYVFPKLYRLAL